MKIAAIASLLALFGLASARAAERSYVVDAARSSVRVHVGKAGLFKFAGHAHEVLAPRFSGQVVADDAALGRSSVTLAFEAPTLTVSAEGEPPEDVPKVQAKMVGPDLLEVARFPQISFASTSVEGTTTSAGVYDLLVCGELTIHGTKRPLKLPVRVVVQGDALTATGRAELKHTDYGLRPISVAGVVKVKNEIGIDFEIVAQAPIASGE